MRIVAAMADTLAAIGAMRLALWPDSEIDDLAELAGRTDSVVLIARAAEDEAIGFAEISLRHDYVNGCDASPVAFLEGLYVEPAHRRQGVAKALVAAGLDWARAQGIAEFASDALLDNAASHAFHAAIGFEETERVVYFRRPIAQAPA